MEDGIIESETIISPLKIGVRGRDHEEDSREREKRQRVDRNNNGVGLIDNLLSKIASPKATATCTTTFNDEYNHRLDANTHSDHHQEGRIRDSDDDDGGGEGDKSRADGGGGGDSGYGGGVISNLFNSFFHKSTEPESEDEDVKKKNNNASLSEEEMEGKSDGSETINKVDQQTENTSINGVSSFMSSLVPEGPEADEASMLIHSVVHD